MRAALKEDDPQKALQAFKAIVDGEEEKGDWCARFPPHTQSRKLTVCCRGFKALKQSTKLQYLRLHRQQEALATYIQLLSYTKSAVTRNYSEKSINGILDYVGGASKTGTIKDTSVDLDILEKFYEATRVALTQSKNEVRLILHRYRHYLTPCVAHAYQDQPQARQVVARSQGIQSAHQGARHISCPLFTSS